MVGVEAVVVVVVVHAALEAPVVAQVAVPPGVVGACNAVPVLVGAVLHAVPVALVVRVLNAEDSDKVCHRRAREPVRHTPTRDRVPLAIKVQVA